MLLAALLVCLFASVSMGADEAALITHLPNLMEKPNFRQYSGYLRASPTHQLHYWFVESQRSPNGDPVVVWFNGGPGCSSMEGLLREHGPFIVQDNTSLVRNPYAWNLRANVLYIEAPAGVGFSYSTDGNTTTNDVQTAKESLVALRDFFAKFPEFHHNELFITGESYGGFYVPSLTTLLLQDQFFSNLKGIAVGNGLNNPTYNIASVFYFAYYHGLFGTSLFHETLKACNCSNIVRCFFNSSTAVCKEAISKVKKSFKGYDLYNLYAPCYNTSGQGESSKNSRDEYLLASNIFLEKKDTLDCTNTTALTLYLNRPDVRSAIHIPQFVRRWEVCTRVGYTTIIKDTSAFYRAILHSKKRVLIYNGDVDMVCNFLGDEWFFDDLKYPVDYSGRKWLLPSNIGMQVGGVSKSYLNGQLLFTTIRGSGHMVPEDKPQAAYHVINRFLNNLPL